MFRRRGKINSPGNFGDVENGCSEDSFREWGSALEPRQFSWLTSNYSGLLCLTRGSSAPSLSLQGQSSSAALAMSKNQKFCIWRKKKNQKPKNWLNFYLTKYPAYAISSVNGKFCTKCLMCLSPGWKMSILEVLQAVWVAQKMISWACVTFHSDFKDYQWLGWWHSQRLWVQLLAPAEVHRRVNPLLLRVFLFLLKTKRSVEFWLF